MDSLSLSLSLALSGQVKALRATNCTIVIERRIISVSINEPSDTINNNWRQTVASHWSLFVSVWCGLFARLFAGLFDPPGGAPANNWHGLDLK